MILQVERDDRCAAVLQKRFPKAHLTREVSDLKELPAETDILASSLHWPEQNDNALNDQVASEHPWLQLPAQLLQRDIHISSVSLPSVLFPGFS